MSRPPRVHRARPAALVLLVLLAAVAACGWPGRPASDAPVVRLRLPALEGGEIDTARYRGRVVVLHLFDTDAPAAALDVDQLEALAMAEPDRATVIGIATDPEGYPLAAAWRRAVRVTYLIGLAGESIRQGQSPLGRLRALPTTLVLDTRGAVAHRIERPLARGELTRLVAPLLGGAGR